jgi:hypothetical protein
MKDEIAIWRSVHPEPLSAADAEEYSKRFTRKIHRWLDSGYGACFLGAPEAGEAMENVLRFFENIRYRLGKWVIMPNHVHVLVEPIGNHHLETNSALLEELFRKTDQRHIQALGTGMAA